MSHKCDLSKVTKQYGHRVSHANNKTKRVFMSNLQNKRIWVPALKRFVKMKISTRAIRTIDKLGLEGALRKYNVSIEQLNNL